LSEFQEKKPAKQKGNSKLRKIEKKSKTRKKAKPSTKPLLASLKKKTDISTKSNNVEIRSKFDELLSTSCSEHRISTTPNAIAFESTDDDDNDDDVKSFSSDDFFSPKSNVDRKKVAFSMSTVKSTPSSTKRDIERIIASTSLTFENSKDSVNNVKNVESVEKIVNRNEDRLMFTESSDDTTSDEDDDEAEAEKVKVKNQEIKNRILKNCFASIAARHT